MEEDTSDVRGLKKVVATSPSLPDPSSKGGKDSRFEMFLLVGIYFQLSRQLRDQLFLPMLSLFWVFLFLR